MDVYHYIAKIVNIIRRKDKIIDIFTAFFTGAATGMIFGVVIMAVAVAIGRNREETD